MKWPSIFFSVNKQPGHILVNRVDAMGDVILALPFCGLIKKYYPNSKISFLGRSYTKSIANACRHIDAFINKDDWNDLSENEIISLLQNHEVDTVLHLLPAKEPLEACRKAGIKHRVGGMNKFSYWFNCNRIVPYSRKKSRLNEAQLNIKLLPAIGINEKPSRNEIYQYYGLTKIAPLDFSYQSLNSSEKFNLILHPLSNKNAKEWGLHNFSTLIKSLDKTRVKIFITGSEKEQQVLGPGLLNHADDITDLSGQLNTDQLMAFIAAADGLVASSTGPVHIAAATGIHTLGLYENAWTKRGERWGPLGKNADYLQCIDEDMDTITPAMVKERIDVWCRRKGILVPD